MDTRPFLVLILKYALALGAAVFVLNVLGGSMYVAFKNWELYAGIVAILFLGAGAWLGRLHTLDAKQDGEPTPCAPPLYQVLSRRELEVLERLLQNETNQQIADHLCIELSTLKTHINKIYKKLAVNNRRELMAKLSGQKIESMA